jgi:hypothetical protein
LNKKETMENEITITTNLKGVSPWLKIAAREGGAVGDCLLLASSASDVAGGEVAPHQVAGVRVARNCLHGRPRALFR